jgi:hypothetical protein
VDAVLARSIRQLLMVLPRCTKVVFKRRFVMNPSFSSLRSMLRLEVKTRTGGRRCTWLAELGLPKSFNCSFGFVESTTYYTCHCIIHSLISQYNADIRALDEQGRSALWHAQVNGSSECAAILIQAGLRPDEECPGGGAVDSGFSEAYRGSSSNNAADNR